MFSTTLKDHLQHLQKIFNILIKKNICLSLKKFFLRYSSVKLLDQKVNILNLITSEDKLKIIMSLEFLCILTQLKKYLKMIRYLCQYILHYAAIMKFLQLRKTLLNRDVQNIEDNTQKLSADSISIMKSTLKKLNVFHQLQSLFSCLSLLVHFDSKHQLYIDLNALKKFNFEAHVYHTKMNVIITVEISKQKSIELIMFLS